MFFFWKTCFANRGFLGLFVKERVSILEPHLGSSKNGILTDFPTRDQDPQTRDQEAFSGSLNSNLS